MAWFLSDELYGDEVCMDELCMDEFYWDELYLDGRFSDERFLWLIVSLFPGDGSSSTRFSRGLRLECFAIH